MTTVAGFETVQLAMQKHNGNRGRNAGLSSSGHCGCETLRGREVVNEGDPGQISAK